MAFPGGFGKNSGPGTAPQPETPAVHFRQSVPPAHPLPTLPNESRLGWDDPKTSSSTNYGLQSYQRPPELIPRVASRNPITLSPEKAVEDPKWTRSPSSLSQHEEISKKSGIFMGRTSFSSPMWINMPKSQSNTNNSPDQENMLLTRTSGGTNQSGRTFHKHVIVPVPKQTRSPTFPSIRGASPVYTFSASDGQKRSPIDYRDLDAPEKMPSQPLAFESSFSAIDSSLPFTGSKMPFSTSPGRAYGLHASSNSFTHPTRDDLVPLSTTGSLYQSQQASDMKHADVLLPKRTRSPTFPSTTESFPENPVFASDDFGRVPDSQSRKEFSKSGKALNFPIGKRAKLPLLPSSDQVIQDNLESLEEIERELQSKAKRLARFKDELSQPMQSTTTSRNQNHQAALEKSKPYEDPKMDATTEFGDSDFISDYRGGASSRSIVGVCPDMCPEAERAERERKGDLDHYERLDGDKNLSSKFIAVKKYTRTAEREAELIRPMPILQTTMDYLLNLLDQPYGDRFLGLYNFLWDRMRAIRMDLRMQHIFDLQAIRMLEQMIRLHVLAMHELCEYTKGEGFSAGFDAHLNIEQMNKTSVELFQFYDDHRKKGIHVPSEREFRGYYALLKLDKHPGYKVEPAELSLDLAKMTPEMRQTPEVLFARDVARACRTGNFIAFFRLARRASYLQACLMHAHFSKSLQIDSKYLDDPVLMSHLIAVSTSYVPMPLRHCTVEENIEDLLEYYGFSVKDFEEPYMMKENALSNSDNDYPIKCSKLVGRKRSKMIVSDISSPSLVESYDIVGLKESSQKRDPEPKSKHLQLIVPGSMREPIDQEMHDSVTNLSPRTDAQNHMHRTFNDLMSQDEQSSVFESQVVPASQIFFDFSNSASENHHIRFENERKLKYDLGFRNSFGRTIKHDCELIPPPSTQERDEEKRPTYLPIDSHVNTSIPQPMFTDHLEEEDQAGVVEEDTAGVETSYPDEEVAKAKLKLVLRTWRRHTTKKKELRDHKRAEATAALNSLSLGPPIWQHEVQSDAHGVFDIDCIMNMRHEIHGRSWSMLNPSDVVAAKLAEKNPDAKCLCWKMLLCSQDETAYGDNIGQRNVTATSAAGSWLHSKFMDASNNGDGDLLVSSPGLAIWKTWIPCQSSADQICCLSVIRSVIFEDLNNAIIGASAVLFLLSESTPLELQKIHLHDLVMSLPSGSCVPLLILSGKENPSTVAKDLGLHDIDKCKVSTISFSFLKDQETKQFDGFFSDECLRGGLEWLASESPEQIDIRSIKLRELVIFHLNYTLEVLDDEMDAYKVGPNHCILAFNEALDRSMESVAMAAHANPICWPCPEIELLEEFSDEYRAVTRYLPSRGWSTSARTETLIHALNHSKLPVWEDEISWLSRGFNISDIENHKMLLESYLMKYLTETSQMIGVGLARKEASVLLQKCAQLELHGSTYHIVPSWVKIFRRIFNWRLMNITTDEVSSTYVLAQRDISAPASEIRNTSELEVHALVPSYIDYPSFDELVEVGSYTLVPVHTEYEAFKPLSPIAPGDDENPSFNETDVLMESGKRIGDDGKMVTYYDHSSTALNNGDQLILSSRPAREADRLSDLLTKCNILQNRMDKKLSIYFNI